MKKLKCIVTGNWSYVTQKNIDAMVASGKAKATENPEVFTYTSREGLTLLAAHGGDLDKARASVPQRVPGKVRCIVTGELMVVSKERMEKLATAVKLDTTEGMTEEQIKLAREEKVHQTYVSRVARQLREKLSPKDKHFATLSAEEQAVIDEQIKQQAVNGTLPRASVPKGQGKPRVKKTPAAPSAETTPAAPTTEVTPNPENPTSAEVTETAPATENSTPKKVKGKGKSPEEKAAEKLAGAGA